MENVILVDGVMVEAEAIHALVDDYGNDYEGRRSLDGSEVQIYFCTGQDDVYDTGPFSLDVLVE